jgi:endo-1,4-beta-xylanase
MLKQLLLTRRRTLWLGLQTIFGIGASISTGIGAERAEARRGHRQQPPAKPDYYDRAAPPSSEVPLKQQASTKGLIYGSSVRRIDLESNAHLASQVTRECEFFVPEWELKWIAGSSTMRPAIDVFNFDDADWMVNFARGRNQRVHGHTLIWHLSLPDWFSDDVNAQNAQKVLTEHIQTVMGRYAGQIYSWDVVNEVIEPADGNPYGLRNSPWLDLLGPAYIGLAFRIAAQTDPTALLVWNENEVEYDIPQHENKRAAILAMIKLLQSQGVPIGAFGIQAHLDANETRFNAQKFRKFLADLAALGLKIMITELDASDQDLPPDPETRDAKVAATYAEFLAVVLSEPAVISIVTWGLSDPYSWLEEVVPREDGLPLRPLPLDQDLFRKPAWNVMANAFDRLPSV